MQELLQGTARSLAGHVGVAPFSRFVETADQRRQHVAVGGVVVVAGPVIVRGHQANGIKAVLPVQCLKQPDAGIIAIAYHLLVGSRAHLNSASSRIGCSASLW